jgi:polar amino acid transport system substrate-binding protein
MRRPTVPCRPSLFAIVVAVLATAVTAASPLRADELRLASDPWPPFTGREGQPRVALALVHEALVRAGHPATTTILDAAAVMPALQSGEYDGSAALWRGAEREEFMLYSEAYLENRLVLVGRTGSEVSATRFADIAGKRLAVVGTYSYGAALEGDPGPTLVPGANLQENLSRLLAGEVDYMLVDELVIASIREYYPDEAAQHLAIGDNALVTRTLHFTLRDDVDGAEAIMVGFNREIQRMQVDGTYNELLGLEWIRVDVDGDGRLDYVHGEGAVGPERPEDSFAVMALLEPGAAEEDSGSYYLGGKTYRRWDDVPYKDRDPARNREKEDAAAIIGLEF